MNEPLGAAPAPVTHDGITIVGVSPSHGPATGGTPVMIMGSNFPEYPLVFVGGQPAYVASRGPVTLTVITPAGTPGALVNVTVVDRTGRDATIVNAFRYDGAGSTPVGDSPSVPGGTTPGGGGTVPGGGGTVPGGTVPGGSGPGGATVPGGGSGPGGTTPGGGAPGTGTPPAGTTPGSGPAPDGSGTPGAPSAPTGPTGTTYRPAPEFGTSVDVRPNLRLAPVVGSNPLAAYAPAQWASLRCTQPTCGGVVIRP